MSDPILTAFIIGVLPILAGIGIRGIVKGGGDDD